MLITPRLSLDDSDVGDDDDDDTQSVSSDNGEDDDLGDDVEVVDSDVEDKVRESSKFSDNH
jgi:hypothetical protein